MRNLSVALLIGVTLAIYACAGSVRTPGGPIEGELPELEYDLVTDEDSSVDAEDVDGEMNFIDDALEGRDTSALPSEFVGVMGMVFRPFTPLGGGFDGRLTVQINYPGTQPNEFEGVRLFLFYIDPTTLATTQMDSARASSGNWVTFNLEALGYFVVAENTSIPRPGTTFTVAAFADLALTGVGTTINFFAVPKNGSEPITYEWDMADGTVLNGHEVSHAYAAAGTYNVVLTAIDADGDVAPTTSTPIEVESVVPPLQSVTINALQGQTPFDYDFSATVSGGNPPFEYAWDFDSDGTTDSTEAAPQFSYPIPGCYEVALTVTDANSASVSDTELIDARRIQLAGQPLQGEVPLSVDFNQSIFQIGATDTLNVDFGDGEVATSVAAAALHTYLEVGSYEVVATASCDIAGQTLVLTSNTLTIIVDPAPTIPYIQLTQPLNPLFSAGGFTIHGFNFGDAQGNSTIVASGVTLNVESWSDTQIIVNFTPPAAAEDVTLSLNTPEGPSNAVHVVFDTGAIPGAIHNVIADVNTPGAPVFIVGHGFGETADSLTINGTIAPIVEWEDNAVLASMPAGVATGAATLDIAIDGFTNFTFNLRAGDVVYPQLDSVDPPVRDYNGLDEDTEFIGQAFGLPGGGLVYCDGLLLPIASWSDTGVLTTDPQRPYDGWAVVLRRQLASNPLDAASIPQPVITSLNPDTASPGETVNIVGTGFDIQGPGDRVILNGVELPVLQWGDTLIRIEIPNGVNDGDVFVEKQLVSNGVFLKVLPPSPPPPGGGQF